jgi:hypothetical protein
MRRATFTTVMTLVTFLFVFGLATAVNYVSSVGKFYFTYPDHWVQMDYRTVDYFLSQNQADTSAYRYDAVFADSANIPFHTGPYLILSVDRIEEMADYQIDSLLIDLSQALETPVKYGNTGDFLSNPTTASPNYDTLLNEVTVLNDITDGDKILKRNLWIMKVFDNGVANFYFFAPDSLFTESMPLFESMIGSFSTENVAEAAPRENLKLADVDDDEDDTNTMVYFAPTGALIVIFVAIMAARKRKNRS